MTEEKEVGPYIAFGDWLRKQRNAAKLTTQPKAVIAARARGLTSINQGKLSHIERGLNGNPDPELLAELAVLYRLNYTDVVARWMSVKYGVVRLDGVHVGTEAATAAADQGAAIEKDQAGLRELKRLNGLVFVYREMFATLKKLSEQAGHISDTADTLTNDRRESGETPRGKRAGGRRYRGPDRRRAG